MQDHYQMMDLNISMALDLADLRISSLSIGSPHQTLLGAFVVKEVEESAFSIDWVQLIPPLCVFVTNPKHKGFGKVDSVTLNQTNNHLELKEQATSLFSSIIISYPISRCKQSSASSNPLFLHRIYCHKLIIACLFTLSNVINTFITLSIVSTSQ